MKILEILIFVVCEKFNGTCPGECPEKCKVCCLNESLQCQCLDVQPQVESEGKMDAGTT